MQRAAELDDGVDPLAKARQTLGPVQHQAIAEHDTVIILLDSEKH